MIQSLQSLAMRASSTTPYSLLSDAVSILNVRSQLQQRFKAGADRALANIDVFLEMSRAYDVRGLRAFARDTRANWQDAVRQVEGRPDAEEQSVALITIHAAKGLEWPVVIPMCARSPHPAATFFRARGRVLGEDHRIRLAVASDDRSRGAWQSDTDATRLTGKPTD